MDFLSLVLGPLTGRVLRCAEGSIPDVRVSRRTFLAGSATASGLLVSQQADARESAPTFAATNRAFAVRWEGRAWHLDARSFDGNPRLQLQRLAQGGYAGSIHHALFSGWAQGADMAFSISQSSVGEWVFEFNVPSLGVSRTLPLRSWLAGEEIVCRATQMRIARSAGAGQRVLVEAASFTLDCSWKLGAKKISLLKVGKRQFSADYAHINLCRSESVRDIQSQIVARSAKLIQDRPWLLSNPQLRVGNEKSSHHLQISLGVDGRTELLVEPEQADDALSVRIKIADQGLANLLVENFRFVESVQGRRTTRRLIGDIADHGSELDASGVILQLSGQRHASRFSVETKNGALTHLYCKPAVVGSVIRVEGAVASPQQLTQPQIVSFVGGAGPSDSRIDRVRLAQLDSSQADASQANPIYGGTDTLTGHVVCKGCASDLKPQDIRYFSTYLTRPQDLLSLGFEFFNFGVKTEKDGKRFLEPLPVPGPALIVVHFPPQHILEDAYNEDLGCTPNPPTLQFPLGSRVSAASRLVFEYPRAKGRLALNLEALTNWEDWSVRKVADKRHPRLIQPPQWNETAVELPSKIISHPADGTHWQAKKYEGKQAEGKDDDRYVLFHASLAANEPFDPTEPFGARRPRFVPVWTPDFVERGVEIKKTPAVGDFLRSQFRILGLGLLGKRDATTPGCVAPSGPALLVGQSDPLSETERQQIVRLSHDSTICATPPAAKYFQLSARGGFADIEGYWPQNRARSCVNISLEKWNQIITEGQDQKIAIEKRFFCFPYGHRLIYLKDTNRKVHFQEGKYYAVEKTTYRLVLRQRAVDYGLMRLAPPAIDLSYQLPYRSLTITDRVVPNLDEPTFIPGLKTLPLCLDAFWPTRCGKLLELNFEGVDWIGNVVKFRSKVLLVQDTALPEHVDEITNEYLNPTTQLTEDLDRKRHDLAGQLLALARGYQKGDTEVDARLVDMSAARQNLKFGSDYCPPAGQPPPPPELLCEILDYSERELSAPFYPHVTAIEGRLPTLARISSADGGKTWLEITDPKAPGDALEVFAIQHLGASYASAPLTLNFQNEADRAGGVASPTPQINALSTLKGPVGISITSRQARSRLVVGAPNLLALGVSDLPTPSTFFSPLNARLCGSLPVTELLSELGLDLSMPLLQNFLTVGGDTASTTGFVYSWETDKLKNWPDGDFGFQFKNSIADGGDKSRLTIRGGVELQLDTGIKPYGFIDGSLDNFRLRLVFAGNGIEAPFHSVRFTAPLGEKANFDIQLGDVKFVGPVMEFAGALKEFLGLGDGYDIDVRHDSLTASIGPFALPSIGFGVFAISNVGFTARCKIYFRDNKPLTFGFAFSSRDTPFTVAVAFMAGRGHFLFEVDTSGLQRIEASLEFGAYAELALGVAHGYLYVMGGVFYSSIKRLAALPAPNPNGVTVYETDVVVEIYVRFGGCATALGFISISVDVHLGLSIIKKDGKTLAEGRAVCTYSVTIGFFKKSFSVTYSRSLAGSDTGQRQTQSIALQAPFLIGAVADGKAKAASRGSCVEAISQSGFQTYWYAYRGRWRV